MIVRISGNFLPYKPEQVIIYHKCAVISLNWPETKFHLKAITFYVALFYVPKCAEPGCFLIVPNT